MPSLFDTFRFTANDGVSGDQALTPLISGLKRSWQKEGETRSYRQKIVTKMLFRKADYSYFRSIFDAGDCNEVSFLIENLCGGVWATWFEGVVPVFQGEYNASRCEVTFDVIPADVYECANKSFNKGANWLEYGTPTSIKTFQGTVETISCVGSTTWPAPDAIWHYYKGCWDTGHTSSSDPDAGLAWRPVAHDQYFVFLPGPEIWKLNTNTTWARETIDSATTPPGDGWINIGGTTWVRPVNIGFPITGSTNQVGGSTWEAQIVNQAPVSNGRALGDVLTEALLALGCDFNTIVSDFFNINPDATAPSNVPYTYASDNFQNVFFFQKSDIVRASASNDATRFTINMRDFLKELELLNVTWAITNVAGVKTLRIEHYTYFNGTNGLNLVTLGDGRYIAGLDSFKSEVEVPSFESFAWQESYREKFLTKRIEYPQACATTQGNERTAGQMCADFGGLIENPNAGLEGFFLMATADIGGGEFLMNTLGGEANGAFAWENLIPALWADGRFHMDATANVPGYSVNSVAKTKEQSRITIRHCCSDAFEPSNLVNTQLGWGEVKEAVQDTETGTLTLTLLH